MLMRPDDGGVDDQIFEVRIIDMASKKHQQTPLSSID